ncbi:alpha-glucosidase (family GH31 glycosyl hydrolase) [Pedobacter psychrotolerans]|uniref:Alpha-glucosidase n=1 Tax=Pedobacter psychrotolerans TaxID=1843235 RepID=A0A4R2HC49_9SPHI|nr:TIM-barrel domain-containing protein [Pedobacter psychrotolerans]TCO25288.1 alpha-glucosidase (family GH31 glycosyl hydrolase) [Pedobacter psychrotolerans]GGE46699.1 alpha-glucosidase [Pedobacter psychrotolerans]
MLNKFLAFLLVLLSSATFGQTIGDYKNGFKRQGNTISLTTTNGMVKLDLCTPEMFRIRTSWNRQFEPNENLMVIKYDWEKVIAKVEEQKDQLLLTTAKLKIRINKAPFKIDVFDLNGKILTSERGGSMLKNNTSVGVTKNLQADEHFFGFGERMDFMDRRLKKLTLNVGRGKGLPHAIGAYNILEANYCPVPFFMSTKGYGIFLHNSFSTTWDMGSTNKNLYSFNAADGELDYYFIYGPTFPSILNAYTSITGKSPMLPQFALGLHAGTYSGGTWGHEEKTSDRYVIELAKKYRALGIPVDLLWLDSTWRLFGEIGGKGATSFEWRETFKDPKGMFDSIYAMNYKMVGLHLRPRFDNAKKLNLLDQAQAKGYTYPENGKPGEFVNFFDEKATQWWWENGVMRVAKLGAKFLKTDEGSAFGALANESEKVGPTGKDAERLHNVFPIAYAKAPFLAFEKFNGFRGLNQTREGYSGIQRYPYIFAGDWPSEWQYFAPVIKAGLNVGLSGVGSWAHCMGGFEHQADPELYIRWVQFGMFSPIALVFGMDHPGYKEPWNYGEDALRNFKKYDLLRYRLFPYLYTSMHQQYETGLPMMRALVINHQDDENVYEIGDQYMFGDNLMVAPVTTKGAITRSVYLPEGTWFNYWTSEKYEGKSYHHVVAPLDTIPLFVKAGGIIPMQPKMTYAGEKPVDVITLDVFPYGESNCEIYEDDNLSANYKAGNFAITKINSSLNRSGLVLKIAKPVGAFKPTTHQYMAKIHWNKAITPKEVFENNKKVTLVKNVTRLDINTGWYYDGKDKVLWIKTEGNNEEEIILTIN